MLAGVALWEGGQGCYRREGGREVLENKSGLKEASVLKSVLCTLQSVLCTLKPVLCTLKPVLCSLKPVLYLKEAPEVGAAGTEDHLVRLNLSALAGQSNVDKIFIVS